MAYDVLLGVHDEEVKEVTVVKEDELGGCGAGAAIEVGVADAAEGVGRVADVGQRMRGSQCGVADVE